MKNFIAPLKILLATSVLATEVNTNDLMVARSDATNLFKRASIYYLEPSKDEIRIEISNINPIFVDNTNNFMMLQSLDYTATNIVLRIESGHKPIVSKNTNGIWEIRFKENKK